MNSISTPPTGLPDQIAAEAGGVVCQVGKDGIATLQLGQPDERVVTWTSARLDSLDRALQALASDPRVRGLLITGPSPTMFCAGADIHLIREITDAAMGEAAAVRGRTVFARCRKLPFPVVAAIAGPCLGGGLELALYCDLRIASDDPSTQLGLPETKLGIVPGFGGTQNLTRLVGLPTALDLILNGKLLRPKQAKKLGVVDRVVPAERLQSIARDELDRLLRQRRKAPRRRLRGMAFWLTHTPLRQLAVRKAEQALAAGQARFYQAPRAALACCLAAVTKSAAQACADEAKALGATIVSATSKNLVHLFLAGEQKKKLGRHADARSIERNFVVGGGVMGAGIASLSAQKRVAVRLCDLDLPTLARAKARLQQDLDKKLRRRHLERWEAQACQDRLQIATEWGRLDHVDLWLEAVVEDLGTKRRLMGAAIDRGLPADAVLASNTSSLPVAQMAEAVPHPERVVGIHFFNPPEKMPLVEIIRAPATSDATIATACRFALQLGKVPIVVADAPGFLVNRCLAPYLNEAARMLLEGSEPEAIDAAMLAFGMPMGPCRLLDEIGFDVALKVSEVLHHAFPQRMVPCELFAAMVAGKALGQKAAGGLYGRDGEAPGPGRSVLQALRQAAGVPGRSHSEAEIVQRLVYPLVDEAFRCLAEGVVAGEEDLDLGLVLGIGFPPFRGGVARYARSEGLLRIVQGLDELARNHGERFSPSDSLRRAAMG